MERLGPARNLPGHSVQKSATKQASAVVETQSETRDWVMMETCRDFSHGVEMQMVESS